MRFGKRKTVVLDIVAVGALDLLDGGAAARDHRHHVDPEDILHTAARHRAVVLFCKRVQLVGERSGRRPGIDRLFAGRDDVHAAQHAFFHRLINIGDKAEQRDDGNIRVALVEHFVRVGADLHARLDAQLRIVPHVHANDLGIDIDGAHDLGALLMQIAQDILAHLAATVLYHSDTLHKTPLLIKICIGYCPAIPRLYQQTPFSSMGVC